MARIHRDLAHPKNINILCFPFESRRLGITFCLPPIQVADKTALSMSHRMVFSHKPELINPDEAFLITHRRNSNPKGWLWQEYKGIHLTQTTSIYSVFI